MSQISSSAPPMRVILPKSSIESELSSSEPTQTNSWKCNHCTRTFKTDRGRYQRQSKSRTLGSSSVVRIQPNVEVLQPQPLVWGSHSLADIQLIVNATHDEIVHWRKNLFLMPSGKVGKQFIRETTHLLDSWTNESFLCKIALKAVMIMPALQKPKYNFKARDHTDCLKRRLSL